MRISPATYNAYQPALTPGQNTSSPKSAQTSAIQNETGINPSVNTKPAESTTPGHQSDQTKTQEQNNPTGPPTEETINGRQLDQNELQLLEELKKRDQEVRQHEMAHVVAGGRYITSGANFTYTRGPDGESYAVGGEVSIDTAAVPGDPQATIQKMKQVKNAALAPANPSSQDLKVASSATSAVSKAQSELMILQAQEHANKNGTQAFGGLKNASETYEKVNTLPEEDTSTFQIAV